MTQPATDSFKKIIGKTTLEVQRGALNGSIAMNGLQLNVSREEDTVTLTRGYSKITVRDAETAQAIKDAVDHTFGVHGFMRNVVYGDHGHVERLSDVFEQSKQAVCAKQTSKVKVCK